MNVDRVLPELADTASVMVAPPVPTGLPEYVSHCGKFWTAQGQDPLVWMLIVTFPPDPDTCKLVGLTVAAQD